MTTTNNERTITISGKDFKKLQKTPILIKKVFNFYRSGYVPSENKFRTFIYFPARLTDAIVYSEDKTLNKVIAWERMELRERIWNKQDRKFEFHKVTTRLDLKLFKKVVDVVAMANEDFEIEVWDSFLKTKVPHLVCAWDDFIIEGFSAGKIRDLLDALDLADDILVGADDKRGYDWEDSIKDRLETQAFTFKITWSGLETRYHFKEAAPFTVAPQETIIPTISEEDIPFR